jgi:hypothetical protein
VWTRSPHSANARTRSCSSCGRRKKGVNGDLRGERFTVTTVIVGAGDVLQNEFSFLAFLFQINSRATFRVSASRIAPFSRGDLKVWSFSNGMNVTSERSSSLPTMTLRLRRPIFAQLTICSADFTTHHPMYRSFEYNHVSYLVIDDSFLSFKDGGGCPFFIRAVKSTANVPVTQSGPGFVSGFPEGRPSLI